MVSSSITSSPVPASSSSTASATSRTDVMILIVVILATLLVTSIPYLYAYVSAPPEKQFMGILYGSIDHFQYLSWMREAQTRIMVPNQMTPEPSQALLFNFLWWTMGRIQAVTGADTALLYQGMRWTAGAFAMMAIWFFCGVVFKTRQQKWTAFLLATFAAGIGVVWVVEKQLSGLADVRFPFDLYTSEPNTFFTILAFPHFAIATGWIAIIFSLVILGQRSQRLSYAWWAAAASLMLAVQHSYDLFTIYAVLAAYALALLIRERKIPWYMVKLGLIVGLISVWPALQAFLITSADPIWKGVLSQFDNAGAWTPQPLNLILLMGAAWVLAFFGLDLKRMWNERDDLQLFLVTWFLAHVVLVYLPVNFQIHLLTGWQVVGGALATVALHQRVIPWLAKRFSGVSHGRLTLIATGVLLVLVIPTNLYIYAWRILDVRRAEKPYYVSTAELNALDYVESQVQSDDVVFASEAVGLFVPARTGARSFLSHWAQTLDFYGKRELETTFFNPETSDEARLDILNQFSVDYVVYGPEEAALGAYDPADAAFLEEEYNQDGVRVYRVVQEGA